MNWSAIAWFAAMVILLLIEANTVTLLCIWFAVGCLGGIVVSLLGGPLWLQWVAFLVISAALLAALRPLVRKFIKPKVTATNVDAVLGTLGYVTADIDNVAGQGQIKLGGMYWTARSTDGTKITTGTLIRVDRIEGVKAFVSPAPAEQPQPIA